MECYCKDSLEPAYTVRKYEDGLTNVLPHTVARGNGKFVLIADQQAGVRPEASRRGFVDYIHGQRLVSGVFYGELQIRGHQDCDIAREIDSLSCRGGSAATGFDQINLLLPDEPSRLSGSVGSQSGVGVGINETENRSLLRRVEGVASGEDIPLFERTAGYARSGSVPVAKIKIDAIAGGLRQCQR